MSGANTFKFVMLPPQSEVTRGWGRKLAEAMPEVRVVIAEDQATAEREIVDAEAAFGRLPREGGRSPALYRVLFVAGTVEMPLQRSLAGKLDNLDALTDADWDPMNLRINGQPTLQAA